MYKIEKEETLNQLNSDKVHSRITGFFIVSNGRCLVKCTVLIVRELVHTNTIPTNNGKAFHSSLGTGKIK